MKLSKVEIVIIISFALLLASLFYWVITDPNGTTRINKRIEKKIDILLEQHNATSKEQ